jgi:murein DD-endopeptidase MepM/ murein hydrolase activator NlpD
MQISETPSLLIQSSAWEREAGTAEGQSTIVPLRTTWFRRPIDSAANWFIDQTYRYGSTMGGNFQQHQGVEFNNQDGTPVHAIGDGVVVYAGRAERGALTVAIKHDTSVTSPQGGRHNVYSVYYHNNELIAKAGDRVRSGDVISRVGHTGRATNDHLHLEVHAAPTDSVSAIVDSLNRFPAYTTNPELWIQPLPGTGIVAGQVFDSAGLAVPQARVYGLVKPEPRETPYSFAETYGTRNHPHPLYGEHFAVGDVPPGEYVLGVEIHGRKEVRRIRIEAGRLTWVEFRPSGSR